MKSKICLECGKEFIPKNGFQKYCEGPHISKCAVCGQTFEYSVRPSEKPKTCSRECQTELQRITARNLYGVDNVSQIPEVRKKISDNHKTKEFKDKIQETCQKRYGVDNPAQSARARKKLSEIMTTPKYLEGRRKTCLERYGVESPTQTEEVIQKRKNTCIERYGTPGAPKSKSFYAKTILDETKVDEYLAFKNNPEEYIKKRYSDKPSVYTLMHDLGCTETPVYDILIEHNCSDMIIHSYSLIEDEVFNFIINLIPDIKILRTYRGLITPYEVDLYLPEYSLAIEINPAATHNSSVGLFEDKPKPYKYHQMKSKMCKDKNVFLFHIFGYEWKSKPEVIKSMLLNLLGKTRYKFGGRDTYVCELTYFDSKEFLNYNHRQGNSNSKIRLGLRLKSNDELVSVMTFGKLRSTLGKSSNSSLQCDWELVRFCNKLNTSVVGGASKLFNYFIQHYHPNRVVSYSDIAHTKGTLYRNLGFVYIHTTDPNYFWTTDYDTKYLNRVKTQKRNLKSLFKDDDLDLTKSEKQIMEEHGFVRTFDCGVIRWEWNAHDLQ